MQKWEYIEVAAWRNEGGIFGTMKIEVEHRNDDYHTYQKGETFYSFIKKLGEEGWELITVDGGVYHFKRPKP